MTVLPIIDTHVHLWDPFHFRIPWLEEVPLLNRPYGLDEYQEQIQGHPVEAVVCVEVNVLPEEALLEARWLAELSSDDTRIEGIVAAAPIGESTSLRTYVETLKTIDPRMKGVRRTLQDETMPGFCLQPAFVEGVELLSAYDLSFDLCVTHSQLPDAIALVRRCPDTRFILDHTGKPDIRAHLLDPWRDHIQELAALPNVVCKMSGLVTQADHQQWGAQDLAPYVMHILNTFGEDRVLFGGDWPVLLLASSYHRWVQVLEDLTSHLSRTAKQKFWSENARRCYRLSRSKE